MRGEGADGDPETTASAAAIDVPAVLAKLDADEAATRREGVDAVSRLLESEPELAFPAVPKLRELLADASISCHGLVADCLAKLAAESADDVAPSAGAIATFVRSQTGDPARVDASQARADALRCLAHVAGERPGAVVDHVDAVTAAIGADEQSTVWGRATLEALARAYPDRVDAVASQALERSPRPDGDAQSATSLSEQ